MLLQTLQLNENLIHKLTTLSLTRVWSRHALIMPDHDATMSTCTACRPRIRPSSEWTLQSSRNASLQRSHFGPCCLTSLPGDPHPTGSMDCMNLNSPDLATKISRSPRYNGGACPQRWDCWQINLYRNICGKSIAAAQETRSRLLTYMAALRSSTPSHQLSLPTYNSKCIDSPDDDLLSRLGVASFVGKDPSFATMFPIRICISWIQTLFALSCEILWRTFHHWHNTKCDGPFHRDYTNCPSPSTQRTGFCRMASFGTEA